MKILKRILLGIVIIIGIIISLIYINKDKLVRSVVENYNDNYNITINYDNTYLSLFKKFPNANLTINNLTIINDDVKDTLFVGEKVYIAMNIKDLFKKANEKIIIKDLLIENLKLNLLINKDSLSTFSVKRIAAVKPLDNKTNNINNSQFVINIKNYKLLNSDIIYNDLQSDFLFKLKGINHTGSGDFSASKLDLTTSTKVNEMTVAVGKTNYFNKVKFDLDTVLGIDLDNLKFVFKNNSAKLNDLSLVFNGFLDINDNNQEYDIEFTAPNANFKNILSLIPNAYSSNFSGVSAKGIANVNGFFKGELSNSSFPKYTININTKNASFKYPDLPKSITNINFNGVIASNTSNNNVFLDIKDLKFTIDKDTFEANGKITNLTKNPTVDASFKGTLDLENLSKAYPITIENDLKGVLKADFTTQADKKSVEQNNFENIKTSGTASLADFSYSSKDIANPIYVKNAAIEFNTNSILLTNFEANTGKSDMQAKGKLDNLFAFLFDDKNLQGDFDVTSNNFEINDFLVIENKSVNNNENNTKQTNAESLKIPSFLDVKTTFKAKRVIYDDIELKNVNGLVQINNQKATLTDTKANMLEGQIKLNGTVNTKVTPSVFDMDMNIDKFDISKSFKILETFKSIAPIAAALHGKYNTNFNLKGNLNNEFTPEINSLSGDAFAQLFVNSVDQNAIPLLSQLNSNFNFIDFSKLNLNQLKTALSFENGKVSVKPFTVKYHDIVMHIYGSHSFDKNLEYNIKMDVPAKHLGTEAVNLLSKLTNVNKDTIMVPLSTIISGSMLKPTVKIDFKQAITDLGVKVLEYQKQELTNQANDKIDTIINDVISNTGLDSLLPRSKDSLNQNPKDLINNGIKDGVKDVFEGLFGGKKKKKKIE